MSKPKKILDANTIINLYGGTGMPQIEAGNQMLDDLAKDYELVVTSTILDEVGGAQVPKEYRIPPDWFDSNAQVISTPGYDNLENASDRGERSIKSIMDPEYVDQDVSESYYDPGYDYNNSNVGVVSDDNGAFKNTAIDDKVIKTENVVAEHLSNHGVDAEVLSDGKLRIGDTVLDKAKDIVGKGIDFGGKAITPLALIIALSQSAEAAENGDYDQAVDILASFGLGELVGTATGVAGGTLAAQFLKNVPVPHPLVKVAGVLLAAIIAGEVGDAAAQEAYTQALANMRDLGLIPEDLFNQMAEDFGVPSDAIPPLGGDKPAFGDLQPDAGEGAVPIPAHKPKSPSASNGETGIGQAENQASPLVLDLDGDGIELVGVNGTGSVYWDLDQDGMAEATGWVAPDDGLLALDRNGDGGVTDHSELFGTESEDGFIMLAALDSNGDSVIDASDTAFENLLVWQDANSDGYSQTDELYSLVDLGIESIDLNFTAVDYQIAGNDVRSESTFTMTGGVTRQVVDAWFTYDDVNSVYAQSFTLDIRTFFLPTVRGYGKLPDLYIAMSNDETLLNTVYDIAVSDMTQLLDSSFGLEDRIRDIMFKWAGVESVDPNGRGGAIDGQELAYLEAFTDTPFLQRGTYSDPGPQAGQILENTFNDLYNAVLARLLIQSAGATLFSEVATYNPVLDVFEGTFTLDLTAVDTVITDLALSGDDLLQAWNNIIRLVDNTVGLDNLSSGDHTALEDMITDSDPAGSLTLQAVLDTIYEPVGMTISGTSGDDTLTGGTGHDTLLGSDGDDTAYGDDARDTIEGGAGNDALYGEGGNDVIRGDDGYDFLSGGAGDDTLFGGHGNDTYYYESGVDTIRESSGFDTISMAEGISSSQVSLDFSEHNKNDLYIYVDGALAVRVEDHFASDDGVVENLKFHDGTVINIGDITSTVQEGTSGNDNLSGADDSLFPYDTLLGYDGNDTLDGGLGNDILRGGTGDDTYQISDGMDLVADVGGTDKIVFGSGLNSTDVSYSADIDGSLHIAFNGTPYAVIENQFTYGGKIETLEFADAVTVDTSTIALTQNGTSGADAIYGYQHGASGDNEIYGNGGADSIIAYDGDDALYGGSGNDRIYGQDGNDNLDGGTGNDYLEGGNGNDIFIVTDGQDRIADTQGTDKIIFGAAYDPATMTFGRSGAGQQDLDIYFGGVLAATISAHLNSPDSIETLEFADSSTFSLLPYKNVTGDYGVNDTLYGIDDAYFEDDNLYGYSGDDTLNGGVGDDNLYGHFDNDTLIGGAGDDYLEGGSGADTYRYDSGFDTIRDGGSPGEPDVIEFGAGITEADITLTRLGQYDLQLAINGTDAILIQDQFKSQDQIETLSFDDGSSLDLLGVVYTTEGTSGNDNLYGTDAGAGGDILKGYAGDDYLYGYDGDDTLEGGTGADVLWGGDGDDTYVIADAGDEVGEVGGNDTIAFDASYSINDLVLERSGNSDLNISFSGVHTVTITNQFDQYGQVETLEFDDGSVFDLSTQAYTVTGDANANQLHGISYGGNPDDTLIGGDGNDYLWGYLGDDTLDAGSGDDYLDGGDGDDAYYVGAGLDTIIDTGGNDTIYLDAGYDFADMTYQRAGTKDLEIYFSGVKKLTLLDQLTASGAIETLTFADSSTFDLSSLSFEITGTENDDYLYGSDSPGSIDELYGLGGNDRLYGYAGGDTLDGGAGNDNLYGGAGDDSYVFTTGHGSDVLTENLGEGNDTLLLTGGVLPDDVRTWANTYKDLYVRLDSTGEEIRVYGSGTVTDVGDRLEAIQFDDGTVWDLTQGLYLNDLDTGQTQYGSNNDDTFFGNGGSDYLYGRDGNDILDGGADNDTLYGETGDDTYVFSSGYGSDSISEDLLEGNDTLLITGGITPDDVRSWVNSYEDLFVRIASTGDEIRINGSDNVTDVGERLETIQFDDGTVWDLTQGLYLNDLDTGQNVYGSDNPDTILGNGGADRLYGWGGNDILDGGTGNDTLYGDTGDDTYIFTAGYGNDAISENELEGNDTLLITGGITQQDVRSWVNSYEDLYIQLVATGEEIVIYGSDYVTDVGNRLETVQFDDGTTWDLAQGLYLNDLDTGQYVYGSDNADTILGNGGADRLYGWAGNDILDGGTGNDTLYGDTGDDTYIFTAGYGNDAISEDEFEGNDTLLITGGITQQDVRSWVDSSEDLFIQIASTGEQVRVYAGDYVTDVGNRLETVKFDDGTIWDLTQGLYLNDLDSGQYVYGSDNTDTILGNGGSDRLYGYAGNDDLYGGADNDYLYAGDGDDTLSGGAGNDSLDGGVGNDTVSYASTSGAVNVDLSSGSATGEGTDTLSNIENVTGSAYADTITGDGNVNTLDGGAGDDVLYGQGGADVLYGGAGDDTLYSGSGADTVTGGSGADTFIFESGQVSEADTIQDFDTSEGDVLDVADLLSYDPLSEIITDYVQISTEGADSVVSVDADGGADNFVAIATIVGVTGLTDEVALENSGNLIAA